MARLIDLREESKGMMRWYVFKWTGDRDVHGDDFMDTLTEIKKGWRPRWRSYNPETKEWRVRIDNDDWRGKAESIFKRIFSNGWAYLMGYRSQLKMDMGDEDM